MIDILVSGPEMGLPEKERVAWGFQEALSRRMKRRPMKLRFDSGEAGSGYRVELRLPAMPPEEGPDLVQALSRDCGRCLSLGLDLDHHEPCQVRVHFRDMAV